MAGNEVAIADFLFKNIGKVKLNHLGLVNEIGAPNASADKYTVVNNIEGLELISTQDAGKKADIYLNGIGISLKQAGASFPFNRLQRAEMLEVFTLLGFENPENKLARIDKEIDDFHKGNIEGRSRPWQDLFTEADFKLLVKFLMMDGSPNHGFSKHPANLILDAPSNNITQANIGVYTFDEYFEGFKKNIFFAIRRQWVGQSSNSEHGRAVGLAKKVGNAKWVYDDVKGIPRISKTTKTRWREDVKEEDRKTVYMIFVEKC